MSKKDLATAWGAYKRAKGMAMGGEVEEDQDLAKDMETDEWYEDHDFEYMPEMEASEQIEEANEPEESMLDKIMRKRMGLK